MTWTVTIDNGSTFTDGYLFADGKATTVKVLTTPYDLMRCFTDVFCSLAKEAGLKDEADLLRRVEEVPYSTTAGTRQPESTLPKVGGSPSTLCQISSPALLTLVTVQC